MVKNYLQNFKSLDKEIFSRFMRNLGFATSAIYQLKNDYFVLILNASDDDVWPAVMKSFEHYTSDSGQNMHPGWFGTESRIQVGSNWIREWPKGTHFYLPDQELNVEKFLFTTTSASGKRIKGGDLSGPLEALANRIRSIVSRHEAIRNFSESSVDVFMQAIGSDIRNTMDHELRTPLASISGYLSYVKDLQESNQGQEALRFLKIIEAETKIALEAVDRLSFSLGKTNADEPSKHLDLRQEIEEVIKMAKDRIPEIVGEDHSHLIHVNLRKFFDDKCEILAQQETLRWSIWEVLKNAIVFSKSGHIDLSLYVVDRMIVLDIEDDGLGVPSGSEDLIFMRFFQDMKNAQIRKGKRGVGLGLFLARKITEKNLGQLNYIRQKSKSVFRFIWPTIAQQIDYIEDSQSLKTRKSA